MENNIEMSILGQDVEAFHEEAHLIGENLNNGTPVQTEETCGELPRGVHLPQKILFDNGKDCTADTPHVSRFFHVPE